MPFLLRAPRQAILVAVVALAISLQGCDLPSTEERPPPAPTPMSAATSQTLEGITARVQTVFADAHRVVLALTVEGPAQPYGYGLELTWIYEPKFDGPTLTAGGEELPYLPNAGTGMFSGAQTPDGLPLIGHGMIAFDASDLQWDQPRVPLHLSLPLLINNEPFLVPLPVPTGTIPATSTPTQVPPTSRVLTFDFTLDAGYDSRQVVFEPHQEIESDGVIMTLERVDVTASEARVSVRYSETRPDTFLDQMDWVAFSTLVVGSKDGASSYTVVGEPEETCGGGVKGNVCLFSFAKHVLLDRAPVDCTVAIIAGKNAPKHIGGVSPSPLGGWVFHFTVPQAPSEK